MGLQWAEVPGEVRVKQKTRSSSFRIGDWGPAAVLLVASGCVPDVPFQNGDDDGGMSTVASSNQNAATRVPSSNAASGAPANQAAANCDRRVPALLRAHVP